MPGRSTYHVSFRIELVPLFDDLRKANGRLVPQHRTRIDVNGQLRDDPRRSDESIAVSRFMWHVALLQVVS